jgi:hypothetical protein
MKLSDIKGERAVEVIADLIEPIANIASDKECADLFSVKPVKNEDKKVTARKHLVKKVPLLLKTHKRDVIQIVATLDGKTIDEMNLFSITAALIGMIQDEALIELFTSAARNVEETPPIDTCTKRDE